MTIEGEEKISKAKAVVEKLQKNTVNDVVAEILSSTKKTFSCYPKDAWSPLGSVSFAIFSMAGVLEDDPYDYFVDIIEKYHGPLDGKKIIEVASGIYPIVSDRLLKRNPNIESIDVYDPNLIVGYPINPKIKLHPTSFESSTDINNSDLIIAMQPCTATFTVLDAIKKNKIDSTVMLCTCSDAEIYGDFYDDIDVRYNWHYEVRGRLADMETEGFKTVYEDTRYGDIAKVPYFCTKRRYVDDSLNNNTLVKKKSIE